MRDFTKTVRGIPGRTISTKPVASQIVDLYRLVNQIIKINPMENKNNLSELSDEKLIKRRDLFKGILIGMYVVCVILIILLVFIFFNKGFSAISIASFIPVFMLPVITMPLYFQVTLLEKEVKARNLK